MQNFVLINDLGQKINRNEGNYWVFRLYYFFSLTIKTLEARHFCSLKPGFFLLFIDMLRFQRCAYFTSMPVNLLLILIVNYCTLFILFIYSLSYMKVKSLSSHYCTLTSRSGQSKMFCKRSILKNFTKFIGQNICLNLFFINYWPGTHNFIKRESPAKDFSCEYQILGNF